MTAPLWARVLIGVGVAAGMAYAVTPVAILTARRLAFYDLPVGYKGHARPTPYLGGAAVMAAFALAILLGAGKPARTLPLLGGVAVLFVVGTIDDRRTVTPAVRVAVELCLGAALAAAGLGWKLGAGGLLDGIITALWVVAVVNAFNLFDNMDGAASTMALVVAAGTGVLAIVIGDTWAVVGSAALCGACLGFLPYNICSPARIFLGDGGSMPLGLVVAALVANVAQHAEPSSLSLLVGFLLVGIPALDTTLVIVSRRRRRVPLMSGGRDHLTHRMRMRLGTPRRVAVVLGSAQALLSALVVVASQRSSATLVYIVLAFVVGAAAAIVALEDAVPATAGPQEDTSVLTLRRRGPPWTLPLLAALGLGAGISPFLHGYYDLGVWVSIGLVVVVVAAVAILARPPAPSLVMVLAVVGIAGLGLWSLLSTGWATATEPATVDANLWLTYAAFLLLVFALLRGRLQAGVLLAAAAIGIVILGASILVRMLGSDGASLFLGGRLNSPLGYINGEGCVFAMGCWLTLALAERREPLLAGAGAAGTVALASLTLLSQSRGAAIALFASLLVALTVIPGFRRRTFALALVAGGVAIAAPSVLRVYSHAHGGAPPLSAVHSAAGVIILASIVAGVVWALVVGAVEVLDDRSRSASVSLRRAATAGAVVILAAPVAAGIVKASSVEHTLKSQWHAFVHLSEATSSSSTASTSTRLFSGAGNRADYWRIAWNVFASHPVVGVGAGNYQQSYFQQRRTTEPIQNPHSIELQALSELGIVGGLLLALFVFAIALGVWMLRAPAKLDRAARTLMVGATGVAVVWLVDSSGDWMHLIPGVAAIGLCAVAVLCRGVSTAGAVGAEKTTGARGAGRRLRVPTLIGGAGAIFVLAVAGASLLRSGLTQRYVDDARAELRNDPAAAIDDAQRALRLDGAKLDAYYLKAAGLARFDRAEAARATLLSAARQQPDNLVTWTLLGDLEVRAGNLRLAKAYYGQAHELDPRNPALAQLAAHPASALRQTTGGF